MRKKKQKKIIIPKKQDVLDFCQDVVNRVQREYGMSDYRVRFKFESREHDGVMAEIRVDHEYLRATITILPIFVAKYKQKKFGELKEVLCHEIFHIKTSPIEDMALNRWGNPDTIRLEIERLTEIYGRLVYKVMTAEKKFKK